MELKYTNMYATCVYKLSTQTGIQVKYEGWVNRMGMHAR